MRCRDIGDYGVAFGPPGKQLGRKERQQNESDNFFHKTSMRTITPQGGSGAASRNFPMIVATPYKVRNREKRRLRQILEKLTVNVPVTTGHEKTRQPKLPRSEFEI